MILRYAPGKYREGFTIPVRQRATGCRRDRNVLTVVTDSGERSFDLGAFSSTGELGRKRSAITMALQGVVLFLAVLCFGGMIRNAVTEGIIAMTLIWAILSAALATYKVCDMKGTVEQFMFGGIESDAVEIGFQSVEEKSGFEDILAAKHKTTKSTEVLYEEDVETHRGQVCRGRRWGVSSRPEGKRSPGGG